MSSGGGEGGGSDYVLVGLQGAVADADEKLKTAMRTGIGIPAAQAALAAAKANLRNHKGSGKGKAQGGLLRPKFKRHQHHQNL